MVEEAKDDVEFLDAESWSGGDKEKLTFREIVLSHVKRIGILASVEFRGGYWQIEEVPMGQYSKTTKTYISDTREIYSNAVEYLFDILYSHFDKKMLSEGEEIDKLMDKAFKDNTIGKEADREEETDDASDRSFQSVKDRISFRSERVNINRKLFRAMCSFLKRIDYFKGKVFEDSV